MFIENPLARQFYMEMARIEHWDTRTLAEKIDKQLYERTAISRKPEYEGQMLLYLRYLNKNERKEGEDSPIGLWIHRTKDAEQVRQLRDSATDGLSYRDGGFCVSAW